nr:hypothetical protein [Tanacetum cinerariifolium]
FADGEYLTGALDTLVDLRTYGVSKPPTLEDATSSEYSSSDLLLSSKLSLFLNLSLKFLIRFWRNYEHNQGKDVNIDGFVHQQYDVVKVRNEHVESESDDDEDYYLNRDEMGKPFYGPNRAKYLNCDDRMDRALTLRDVINPFKKAPNYSGNNTKEDGDGKWNVKIRVMDPYENVFE